AVRIAPRAGRRPEPAAEGRTAGAARGQRPLPARQPASLQPQVLPALESALRRLRARARPAAGRNRGPRRRGLPSVPDARGRAMTAGTAAGLVLGLASAGAIGGGFALQHRETARLPALSLRRPLYSLRALVGRSIWLAGSVLGLAGWAAYVVALRLGPL